MSDLPWVPMETTAQHEARKKLLVCDHAYTERGNACAQCYKALEIDHAKLLAMTRNEKEYFDRAVAAETENAEWRIAAKNVIEMGGDFLRDLHKVREKHK